MMAVVCIEKVNWSEQGQYNINQKPEFVKHGGPLLLYDLHQKQKACWQPTLQKLVLCSVKQK